MPTDVFSALANPVRRKLLDCLRDGPRAMSDLAGAFELGPLPGARLSGARLLSGNGAC
ncbi:hypothetical protein [Kitasatospora sp. HPMI-4]|uniref:hypothetical protein n=1 Tax=Kitasatospora sp. HPMI-4 TaxID=3448443 RepID=UPI003F1A95F9